MSKWKIYFATIAIFLITQTKCIQTHGNDFGTFLKSTNGPLKQKLFLLSQYDNFLTDNSTEARILGIGGNEDPTTQVAFYLYTRASPNKSEILEPTIASITNSSFDKNKETRFMTHGFWSGGYSDTSQGIKNAYLIYQDVNIIIVDWKDAAATINYIRAAMRTKPIGRYLGQMVDSLVEYGADPKQIHLIGHSLGAHISGFAGNATKHKIYRITGLDPAGPLFETFKIFDEHLSVGDADFVDIIHTSAGSLGFQAPIGNADFYPNQGKAPQPGCKDISYLLGDIATMTDGCSHGRSWEYYTDSINPSELFKANPIDRSLRDNTIVRMGEFADDPRADGIFYLKTNDKPPFSLDVA